MSENGSKQTVGGRKDHAVVDWIRKAPKAELHVHLDGAFDVALLWKQATSPIVFSPSLWVQN
eukprot:2053849-Rhodomonas_salina.4